MINFFSNQFVVGFLLLISLSVYGPKGDFDVAGDLVPPVALVAELIDARRTMVGETDEASVRAFMENMYSPDRVKHLVLIKPSGERVLLFPAFLAGIIQRMKTDVASVGVDEMSTLVPQLTAFFEDAKTQLAEDTVFYGLEDVPGFSCGELETYAGAEPASEMSKLCPVYVSILYSELLLDILLFAFLKQHPESIDLYKDAMTNFIVFRQAYLIEYSHGYEDRYRYLNVFKQTFVDKFNERLSGDEA